MSYVRCLRGMGSGREYAPGTVMNLDPVDNLPVEIVLDIDRLRTERPGLAWYHPERRDLWRFGALMPLDPDDPADGPAIVSLGEGCTPRRPFLDHPLARRVGFRLEVKDEGVPVPGYGRNPTLSFKDRGMSVVVSMARKLGLHRLAVPTQGNAGDALAEYAVAAGLEAVIVMPADTPMPIRGKVSAYAAQYPNIRLEIVEGTIREAGKLVRERYVPEGYFNVATFQEPGWRLEGKKTMGLELAEPRPGEDRWQLPDVVVYPTGGGTGIVAMWKAFDELEALGLIDARRPRLVAVQTEGTAPLVAAFARGDRDTCAVEPAPTMATGLKVPAGIGHFRVLDVLYRSGGAALAVSEAAIAEALRDTYYATGWWICPEGAACLAALEPLVERGLIRPGDHVVTFNTASMEKYFPSVRALVTQEA